MASEDASHPSIALDVHAELGPSRQRQRAPTISRHDKRRSDARFYFNKIIASHYRDQSKEYSDVASLFITWKENDLLLHKENNEVSYFSVVVDDCRYCANVTCSGRSAKLDIQA